MEGQKDTGPRTRRALGQKTSAVALYHFEYGAPSLPVSKPPSSWYALILQK